MLSREQKSLELKASDNIRDSCFLIENDESLRILIVIIQNKLHNGEFVYDFYHKILLEIFFDRLISSKQFDIFHVKEHIQPLHIN